MKALCRIRDVVLLALLITPVVATAQFTFTTNNGAITITGYTGPGGNVAIPSTTNGLPVTSIGIAAFYGTGLTSVSIGSGVTNIGDSAFSYCSMLTTISVDMNNPSYSSVAGVLFDKSKTEIIVFPGGLNESYNVPNNVTIIGDWSFTGCSLTNVSIQEGVTSIGSVAFATCQNLTSVRIPSSVTSIGIVAFGHCTNLTKAFFLGNAPNGDNTIFSGESGIAYYLPGTTGWGSTFGGWPTALWYQPNPMILDSGYGLGPSTNGFGFTISWATNIPVVVEACTDLANPIWTPVTTNALLNGTNYFRDADWTNFPNRFYRVRSP